MLSILFRTGVFNLTVALQVWLLLACVRFVRCMSGLFQMVKTAQTATKPALRCAARCFFLERSFGPAQS